MLNIMLWITAGAAIGWIGCAAFGRNAARGAVIAAAIGMIGAFFGGDIVAPLLGSVADDSGALRPFALVVAVATAVAFVSVGDMVCERFGF